MNKQQYNNKSYWIDLHESFSGSLRAVGWPSLSEAFNQLKYESESEGFIKALSLAAANKDSIRFLEVGVGIGFWTGLTKTYASKSGIALDFSALDISADALALVRERYPDVTCIEADLTKLDGQSVVERYDIVTAIMVLLHLTNFDDYQNALRFCAESVKAGGMLIIYEPLLIRNYSPFLSERFSGFQGNSYTQVKFHIDNILHNLGFEEVASMPGASWVLNAPIQAGSKAGYLVKHIIWLALYGLIYKSETLTKALQAPLLQLDALFKKKHGDSGTFVVYRKGA